MNAIKLWIAWHCPLWIIKLAWRDYGTNALLHFVLNSREHAATMARLRRR
jgi:hypothetical protein